MALTRNIRYCGPGIYILGGDLTLCRAKEATDRASVDQARVMFKEVFVFHECPRVGDELDENFYVGEVLEISYG